MTITHIQQCEAQYLSAGDKVEIDGAVLTITSKTPLSWIETTLLDDHGNETRAQCALTDTVSNKPATLLRPWDQITIGETTYTVQSTTTIQKLNLTVQTKECHPWLGNQTTLCCLDMMEIAGNGFDYRPFQEFNLSLNRALSGECKRSLYKGFVGRDGRVESFEAPSLSLVDGGLPSPLWN